MIFMHKESGELFEFNFETFYTHRSIYTLDGTWLFIPDDTFAEKCEFIGFL